MQKQLLSQRKKMCSDDDESVEVVIKIGSTGQNGRLEPKKKSRVYCMSLCYF